MMRDHKLWTWHVGAGIVILVLLGLHMAVMHLDDDAVGVHDDPGGLGLLDDVGIELILIQINNLCLGKALYQGAERVGEEKIMIQQDHIDVNIEEAKGNRPPVERVKC